MDLRSAGCDHLYYADAAGYDAADWASAVTWYAADQAGGIPVDYLN